MVVRKAVKFWGVPHFLFFMCNFFQSTYSMKFCKTLFYVHPPLISARGGYKTNEVNLDEASEPQFWNLCTQTIMYTFCDTISSREFEL